MTRENHPTIDNPRLALDLFDKFSGLWEEPRIDEVCLRLNPSTRQSVPAHTPCFLQGFDYLLTLPSLPPGPAIDASLVSTLLELALATPANPLAPQQRQKKPAPPRAQYGFGAPPGAYRRPDGFVDDGTWRPPALRSAPPPPPNAAGADRGLPPWQQPRGYGPPRSDSTATGWAPPPVGYQTSSPVPNRWNQGPPHVWGQGRPLGGSGGQTEQRYPSQ